jgi:hypothetical protein
MLTMGYNIDRKVFKKGNKYYMADKSFVMDAMCPETMIFPCDENGEVTSWLDVYCDRTDKTLDQCIKEFMSY